MSNQFLNSESIFEVIGNYPVVDQFDVLYTNLQSGSYVDKYITGSMFVATIAAPTGRGGFTYSTPTQRGRAFSKLGVDATKLPTQDLSDTNRSYNLQPWRERAGTVKNLKVFSNSERFYDSLLPDLSKMIKTVGGNIEGISNFSLGLYGNTLDLLTVPIFLFTFPFESLFSSVARQAAFSKGFIATSGTDDVAGLISKRLLIQLGSAYAINAGFFSGGGYVMSHSPRFTAGITPVNSGALSSDVVKTLFGFGDANTYAYDLPYTPGKGYTHLPVFRSGSVTGGVGSSRVFSPVIRGWKYGVQDGNPHYTSCVFRRDRFGQHRDMLEQRLYPVSYLDYDNAPTRYFGDFETSAMPNPSPEKVKNVTIEYPVTVTFVKQQVVTLGTGTEQYELLINAAQNSNQTFSSNLSPYATSSLPYFDLENTSLGRNRGEIPNTVIDPESVFTTV
jgi:hypothetical protein